MTLELANSSAVVAAHQFNPSIVNQLWLVNHGLLQEDDFRAGCVFTDMLVQVQSREFNLLVTPDQCQFNPQVEADCEQQVLVDKLGAIVRTLPHTPYRAAGLNFIWHIHGDDDQIGTLSRRLFFVDGSPLHAAFDEGDALFGGYLSKNALGCRLKLDAKPVTGDTAQGQRRVLLQLAFNFHLDVAKQDNPVAAIEQLLEQWTEARQQSSLIVEQAAGRDLQ